MIGSIRLNGSLVVAVRFHRVTYFSQPSVYYKYHVWYRAKYTFTLKCHKSGVPMLNRTIREDPCFQNFSLHGRVLLHLIHECAKLGLFYDLRSYSA